jgi:uncharacterized membrane protein
MAGEPESLHIHEPLKARIERHDYDRLLMLSDGVFAIAITLLALELRLPEQWDGSIERLMSVTGRPLVGYLFGFGLVGAFWLIHRRLFARLEQVDRVVTLLNILLLGLVGLTPFIARMIAEAGPNRAMPFYLVSFASVLGTFALMRIWAAVTPRLLHSGVDRHEWTTETVSTVIGAVGLGALGIWAVAEHRAVDSELLFAVIISVVGGRKLMKTWRERQMSSVSRP